MKINLNADRENMLSEFAENEKPAEVKARIDKVNEALTQAGLNLGTRTTQAALLGIVYGVEEEMPETAHANEDIRYFIECVKPAAVQDRKLAIQTALAQEGYGLTRTTRAACQLIADGFEL